MKHALVTGAAGGIGLAVVRRLAREGFVITATDIQPPRLPTGSVPTGSISPGFARTDPLPAGSAPTEPIPPNYASTSHNSVSPFPTNVEFFTLDVTDENAVQTLVSDVWRNTGPIDLLVNGAGVFAHGPAIETSGTDWDRLFAVNARGVFLVSRTVGARMAARGNGSIVTISSNAGTLPRAGMAAYAASKAAASSITRSLGLELGRSGVRCNVVSPGTTRTTMISGLGDEEQFIQGFPETFKTGIPLGRIAEPEDIAEAVAFFASDEARHITLQELVVDGGASQS